VIDSNAAYEIITPKPPLLPEDDTYGVYDTPATMSKSQYSTPAVQATAHYGTPAPQPPGQYSMPGTVPQPADMYLLMGYAHHTVEAPGPSATYQTLGGDSAAAGPRQQNYDSLGGESAGASPRQQNYDTFNHGFPASSAAIPCARAGNYDRLDFAASPSRSNAHEGAEYNVAMHMASSPVP
jgi:hypothetical protein